jgi:hypothetical protein
MKFLYIITLTTLFIAFTSAQDVDEGNGSEVVDAPEDNESDASISYSVGSNKEDFGLVEHGGEDLILVKKTVDGHLTTEYFTVVDVDVKSNSEGNTSNKINP